MSNNLIEFKQHIKTSSRARKGYRTYQYTHSIDARMDDKLGEYSVYVSTAYPNIGTVKLEDRPELFLVYDLDPYTKVVCKSVYIGPDLHSYPPRPGNYIAHSLVTDTSARFSPVEVYEKAPWKSGQAVAEEDNSAQPIPEIISTLRIQLDTDYVELKWFNDLLIPDPAGTNSPIEEMARRQKMFMTVIDAVIRKQKVIIVDDKTKLLKWTMSLLQCFPLDFVNKYLTITSFANSHELLDICQVLCFETESSERVRRFADKATIIDINNTTMNNPGAYARSLLAAIQTGEFTSFRNEVFARIAEGHYSAEQFDKCAGFFSAMANIAEMPEDKFKEFFAGQTTNASNKEKIIRMVLQQEKIELCNVIWRTLLNQKPVTADDLSTYNEVAQYTIPDRTDELWIKLEKDLAERVTMQSLEQVQRFFNITPNILHPDRNAAFFNKVMHIIYTSPEQETKEKGITMIREFIVGELTDDQKRTLEKMQEQIDLLDMLEKAPIEEQYQLLFNSNDPLDEELVTACIPRLKHLTWKYFFEWMKNDTGLLKKLFEIGPLINKLPDKSLALSILQANDGEVPANLQEHFQKLPDSEAQEFLDTVTPAIRNKLIEDMSLEQALAYAPQSSIPQLLQNIIARYSHKSQQHRLWRLCEVIHSGAANKSEYPNVINKIRKTDLSPVYTFLDDENVQVPPEFHRLATILSKEGSLKRPIPVKEMQITLDNIRAIGKLEHISQIGKYLKKHGMDKQFLYALIKLPWPHYAWEAVFNELDERDRYRLPILLREILEELKRDHPLGNRSTPYSFAQWWQIVHQYFIFLIINNEYPHFKSMINNIEISWQQYDFIHHQLLVLMPGVNPAFNEFERPGNLSRRDKKWGGNDPGPHWRNAIS